MILILILTLSSYSWLREKAGVSRLQELKNALDVAMTELATAERIGELESMSRLRYDEIPRLQKELAAEEKLYEEQEKSGGVKGKLSACWDVS